MDHAWIAGKPAALDALLTEAATLLDKSRHPLIAGLGTDVAGAARRSRWRNATGAVIDHMNSRALLRDLDVMRSSGVMLTTPSEAQTRADTLLLVGPGLSRDLAGNGATIAGQTAAVAKERRCRAPHLLAMPRRRFGAGASAAATIETIGKEPGSTGATRSRCVRALPAGRWARPRFLETAGSGLEGLKTARFGVAVWSAATLDALAIEMICGLVNDLNATTRFSALPLAPADNAMGVLQACGWTDRISACAPDLGADLPNMILGFSTAGRLVDSCETDCVLWISAYRADCAADGDAAADDRADAAGMRAFAHRHAFISRSAAPASITPQCSIWPPPARCGSRGDAAERHDLRSRRDCPHRIRLADAGERSC